MLSFAIPRFVPATLAALLAVALGACQPQIDANESENAPLFSPDSPQPLMLAVVTSPLQNGLRIEGKTNLPSGTELMLSIQRGPVVGGTKVAVQSGRFSADVYPRQGQPIPSGNYEVEVSTPLVDLQPAPVKAALGPNYGAVTGPLVVDGLFGGKIIEYATKVQIGGRGDPAADKAARQTAYREHEAYARRSCEAHPAEVERMSGTSMSRSERTKSIQRCLGEMATARSELVAEGLLEP